MINCVVEDNPYNFYNRNINGQGGQVDHTQDFPNGSGYTQNWPFGLQATLAYMWLYYMYFPWHHQIKFTVLYM